jgi:hypothetical protein
MSRRESHILQLHRVLNSVRAGFREADQRAGQRASGLAIEVVKLLVKPLMKLYQIGPICSSTAAMLCLNADRSIMWEILQSFGHSSSSLLL